MGIKLMQKMLGNSIIIKRFYNKKTYIHKYFNPKILNCLPHYFSNQIRHCKTYLE